MGSGGSTVSDAHSSPSEASNNGAIASPPTSGSPSNSGRPSSSIASPGPSPPHPNRNPRGTAPRRHLGGGPPSFGSNGEGSPPSVTFQTESRGGEQNSVDGRRQPPSSSRTSHVHGRGNTTTSPNQKSTSNSSLQQHQHLPTSTTTTHARQPVIHQLGDVTFDNVAQAIPYIRNKRHSFNTDNDATSEENGRSNFPDAYLWLNDSIIRLQAERGRRQVSKQLRQQRSTKREQPTLLDFVGRDSNAKAKQVDDKEMEIQEASANRILAGAAVRGQQHRPSAQLSSDDTPRDNNGGPRPPHTSPPHKRHRRSCPLRKLQSLRDKIFILVERALLEDAAPPTLRTTTDRIHDPLDNNGGTDNIKSNNVTTSSSSTNNNNSNVVSGATKVCRLSTSQTRGPSDKSQVEGGSSGCSPMQSFTSFENPHIKMDGMSSATTSQQQQQPVPTITPSISATGKLNLSGTSGLLPPLTPTCKEGGADGTPHTPPPTIFHAPGINVVLTVPVTNYHYRQKMEQLPTVNFPIPVPGLSSLETNNKIFPSSLVSSPSTKLSLATPYATNTSTVKDTQEFLSDFTVERVLHVTALREDLLEAEGCNSEASSDVVKERWELIHGFSKLIFKSFGSRNRCAKLQKLHLSYRNELRELKRVERETRRKILSSAATASLRELRELESHIDGWSDVLQKYFKNWGHVKSERAFSKLSKNTIGSRLIDAQTALLHQYEMLQVDYLRQASGVEFNPIPAPSVVDPYAGMLADDAVDAPSTSDAWLDRHQTALQAAAAGLQVLYSVYGLASSGSMTPRNVLFLHAKRKLIRSFSNKLAQSAHFTSSLSTSKSSQPTRRYGGVAPPTGVRRAALPPLVTTSSLNRHIPDDLGSGGWGDSDSAISPQDLSPTASWNRGGLGGATTPSKQNASTTLRRRQRAAFRELVEHAVLHEDRNPTSALSTVEKEDGQDSSPHKIPEAAGRGNTSVFFPTATKGMMVVQTATGTSSLPTTTTLCDCSDCSDSGCSDCGDHVDGGGDCGGDNDFGTSTHSCLHHIHHNNYHYHHTTAAVSSSGGSSPQSQHPIRASTKGSPLIVASSLPPSGVPSYSRHVRECATKPGGKLFTQHLRSACGLVPIGYRGIMHNVSLTESTFNAIPAGRRSGKRRVAASGGAGAAAVAQRNSGFSQQGGGGGNSGGVGGGIPPVNASFSSMASQEEMEYVRALSRGSTNSRVVAGGACSPLAGNSGSDVSSLSTSRSDDKDDGCATGFSQMVQDDSTPAVSSRRPQRRVRGSYRHPSAHHAVSKSLSRRPGETTNTSSISSSATHHHRRGGSTWLREAVAEILFPGVINGIIGGGGLGARTDSSSNMISILRNPLSGAGAGVVASGGTRRVPSLMVPATSTWGNKSLNSEVGLGTRTLGSSVTSVGGATPLQSGGDNAAVTWAACADAPPLSVDHSNTTPFSPNSTVDVDISNSSPHQRPPSQPVGNSSFGTRSGGGPVLASSGIFEPRPPIRASSHATEMSLEGSLVSSRQVPQMAPMFAQMGHLRSEGAEDSQSTIDPYSAISHVSLSTHVGIGGGVGGVSSSGRPHSVGGLVSDQTTSNNGSISSPVAGSQFRRRNYTSSVNNSMNQSPTVGSPNSTAIHLSSPSPAYGVHKQHHQHTSPASNHSHPSHVVSPLTVTSPDPSSGIRQRIINIASGRQSGSALGSGPTTTAAAGGDAFPGATVSGATSLLALVREERVAATSIYNMSLSPKYYAQLEYLVRKYTRVGREVLARLPQPPAAATNTAAATSTAEGASSATLQTSSVDSSSPHPPPMRRGSVLHPPSRPASLRDTSHHSSPGISFVSGGSPVTSTRASMTKVKAASVSTSTTSAVPPDDVDSEEAACWLQELLIARSGANFPQSAVKSLISTLANNYINEHSKRLSESMSAAADLEPFVATATSQQRLVRASGVNPAVQFLSQFAEHHLGSINLSTAAPGSSSEQMRYLRIAAATELYKGVLHPFAIDVTHAPSCVKEMIGEKRLVGGTGSGHNRHMSTYFPMPDPLMFTPPNHHPGTSTSLLSPSVDEQFVLAMDQVYRLLLVAETKSTIPLSVLMSKIAPLILSYKITFINNCFHKDARLAQKAKNDERRRQHQVAMQRYNSMVQQIIATHQQHRVLQQQQSQRHGGGSDGNSIRTSNSSQSTSGSGSSSRGFAHPLQLPPPPPPPEHLELFPPVLSLQSSDVLYGTSRTVKHHVSLPTTAVLVYNSNNYKNSKTHSSSSDFISEKPTGNEARRRPTKQAKRGADATTSKHNQSKNSNVTSQAGAWTGLMAASVIASQVLRLIAGSCPHQGGISNYNNNNNNNNNNNSSVDAGSIMGTTGCSDAPVLVRTLETVAQRVTKCCRTGSSNQVGKQQPPNAHDLSTHNATASISSASFLQTPISYLANANNVNATATLSSIGGESDTSPQQAYTPVAAQQLSQFRSRPMLPWLSRAQSHQLRAFSVISDDIRFTSLQPTPPGPNFPIEVFPHKYHGLTGLSTSGGTTVKVLYPSQYEIQMKEAQRQLFKWAKEHVQNMALVGAQLAVSTISFPHQHHQHTAFPLYKSAVVLLRTPGGIASDLFESHPQYLDVAASGGGSAQLVSLGTSSSTSSRRDVRGKQHDQHHMPPTDNTVRDEQQCSSDDTDAFSLPLKSPLSGSLTPPLVHQQQGRGGGGGHHNSGILLRYADVSSQSSWALVPKIPSASETSARIDSWFTTLVEHQRVSVLKNVLAQTHRQNSNDVFLFHPSLLRSKHRRKRTTRGLYLAAQRRAQSVAGAAANRHHGGGGVGGDTTDGSHRSGSIQQYRGSSSTRGGNNSSYDDSSASSNNNNNTRSSDPRRVNASSTTSRGAATTATGGGASPSSPAYPPTNKESVLPPVEAGKSRYAREVLSVITLSDSGGYCGSDPLQLVRSIAAKRANFDSSGTVADLLIGDTSTARRQDVPISNASNSITPRDTVLQSLGAPYDSNDSIQLFKHQEQRGLHFRASHTLNLPPATLLNPRHINASSCAASLALQPLQSSATRAKLNAKKLNSGRSVANHRRRHHQQTGSSAPHRSRHHTAAPSGKYGGHFSEPSSPTADNDDEEYNNSTSDDRLHLSTTSESEDGTPSRQRRSRRGQLNKSNRSISERVAACSKQFDRRLQHISTRGQRDENLSLFISVLVADVFVQNDVQHVNNPTADNTALLEASTTIDAALDPFTGIPRQQQYHQSSINSNRGGVGGGDDSSFLGGDASLGGGASIRSKRYRASEVNAPVQLNTRYALLGAVRSAYRRAAQVMQVGAQISDSQLKREFIEELPKNISKVNDAAASASTSKATGSPIKTTPQPRDDITSTPAVDSSVLVPPADCPQCQLEQDRILRFLPPAVVSIQGAALCGKTYPNRRGEITTPLDTALFTSSSSVDPNLLLQRSVTASTHHTIVPKNGSKTRGVGGGGLVTPPPANSLHPPPLNSPRTNYPDPDSGSDRGANSSTTTTTTIRGSSLMGMSALAGSTYSGLHINVPRGVGGAAMAPSNAVLNPGGSRLLTGLQFMASDWIRSHSLFTPATLIAASALYSTPGGTIGSSFPLPTQSGGLVGMTASSTLHPFSYPNILQQAGGIANMASLENTPLGATGAGSSARLAGSQGIISSGGGGDSSITILKTDRRNHRSGLDSDTNSVSNSLSSLDRGIVAHATSAMARVKAAKAAAAQRQEGVVSPNITTTSQHQPWSVAVCASSDDGPAPTAPGSARVGGGGALEGSGGRGGAGPLGLGHHRASVSSYVPHVTTSHHGGNVAPVDAPPLLCHRHHAEREKKEEDHKKRSSADHQPSDGTTCEVITTSESDGAFGATSPLTPPTQPSSPPRRPRNVLSARRPTQQQKLQKHQQQYSKYPISVTRGMIFNLPDLLVRYLTEEMAAVPRRFNQHRLQHRPCVTAAPGRVDTASDLSVYMLAVGLAKGLYRSQLLAPYAPHVSSSSYTNDQNHTIVSNSTLLDDPQTNSSGTSVSRADGLLPHTAASSTNTVAPQHSSVPGAFVSPQDAFTDSISRPSSTPILSIPQYHHQQPQRGAGGGSSGGVVLAGSGSRSSPSHAHHTAMYANAAMGPSVRQWMATMRASASPSSWLCPDTTPNLLDASPNIQGSLNTAFAGMCGTNPTTSPALLYILAYTALSRGTPQTPTNHSLPPCMGGGGNKNHSGGGGGSSNAGGSGAIKTSGGGNHHTLPPVSSSVKSIVTRVGGGDAGVTSLLDSLSIPTMALLSAEMDGGGGGGSSSQGGSDSGGARLRRGRGESMGSGSFVGLGENMASASPSSTLSPGVHRSSHQTTSSFRNQATSEKFSGQSPPAPPPDTLPAGSDLVAASALQGAIQAMLSANTPTSTSCVYLRNHMLTTATTGHHLASVLFNTAPLLPHLVQCSASARQHLRPVAPAINPEDVTVSRFRTYMPPPRGTIPSVDNDLLSLTTVLFGDDIRYKRTLTAAKRASHQQQCERDSKLFALLLESARNGPKHHIDSTGQHPSSTQSNSSEMATKELLARHSNIAIDARSLRTPSSIVPAGCTSQLFVPLATLAKSQQPALSEEDVLLLTVRQRGSEHHYSQHNHTLTPIGDPAAASHNFARFPSLHAANSMSSIGSSNGGALFATYPNDGGSVTSLPPTHTQQHQHQHQGNASHTSTLRANVVNNKGGLGQRHSHTTGNDRSGAPPNLPLHGDNEMSLVPARSALALTTALHSASMVGSLAGVSGVQCETIFSNMSLSHHTCLSGKQQADMLALPSPGPSICLSTVNLRSLFSTAPQRIVSDVASSYFQGGGGGARGSAPLSSLGSIGSDLVDMNSQNGAGATLRMGLASSNEERACLDEATYRYAISMLSSLTPQAATLQTQAFGRSVANPNFLVLTASTDVWSSIPSEDVSVFLGMLGTPDWSSNAASTDSFAAMLASALSSSSGNNDQHHQQQQHSRTDAAAARNGGDSESSAAGHHNAIWEFVAGRHDMLHELHGFRRTYAGPGLSGVDGSWYQDHFRSGSLQGWGDTRGIFGGRDASTPINHSRRHSNSDTAQPPMSGGTHGHHNQRHRGSNDSSTSNLSRSGQFQSLPYPLQTSPREYLEFYNIQHYCSNFGPSCPFTTYVAESLQRSRHSDALVYQHQLQRQQSGNLGGSGHSVHSSNSASMHRGSGFDTSNGVLHHPQMMGTTPPSTSFHHHQQDSAATTATAVPSYLSSRLVQQGGINSSSNNNSNNNASSGVPQHQHVPGSQNTGSASNSHHSAAPPSYSAPGFAGPAHGPLSTASPSPDTITMISTLLLNVTRTSRVRGGRAVYLIHKLSSMLEEGPDAPTLQFLPPSTPTTFAKTIAESGSSVIGEAVVASSATTPMSANGGDTRNVIEGGGGHSVTSSTTAPGHPKIKRKSQSASTNKPSKPDQSGSTSVMGSLPSNSPLFSARGTQPGAVSSNTSPPMMAGYGGPLPPTLTLLSPSMCERADATIRLTRYTDVLSAGECDCLLLSIKVLLMYGDYYFPSNLKQLSNDLSHCTENSIVVSPRSKASSSSPTLGGVGGGGAGVSNSGSSLFTDETKYKNSKWRHTASRWWSEVSVLQEELEEHVNGQPVAVPDFSTTSLTQIQSAHPLPLFDGINGESQQEAVMRGTSYNINNTTAVYNNNMLPGFALMDLRHPRSSQSTCSNAASLRGTAAPPSPNTPSVPQYLPLPSIPPPPPLHVRLYRRFRVVQAQLSRQQRNEDALARGYRSTRYRYANHAATAMGVRDPQAAVNRAPPKDTSDTRLSPSGTLLADAQSRAKEVVNKTQRRAARVAAAGPGTPVPVDTSLSRLLAANPTSNSTGDSASHQPGGSAAYDTSPAPKSGDDFRNVASVLTEVIVQESEAISKLKLRYTLVRQALRQRAHERREVAKLYCRVVLCNPRASWLRERGIYILATRRGLSPSQQAPQTTAVYPDHEGRIPQFSPLGSPHPQSTGTVPTPNTSTTTHGCSSPVMNDLLSSVFPFAPAQEDLVLRFAHMCLEVEVVLAEELATLKAKYDGIVASAAAVSAQGGVSCSTTQSATTLSNSGATTTTNVMVAGIGSGSVGDSIKDDDEATSSSSDGDDRSTATAAAIVDSAASFPSSTSNIYNNNSTTTATASPSSLVPEVECYDSETQARLTALFAPRTTQPQRATLSTDNDDQSDFTDDEQDCSDVPSSLVFLASATKDGSIAKTIKLLEQHRKKVTSKATTTSKKAKRDTSTTTTNNEHTRPTTLPSTSTSDRKEDGMYPQNDYGTVSDSSSEEESATTQVPSGGGDVRRSNKDNKTKNTKRNNSRVVDLKICSSGGDDTDDTDEDDDDRMASTEEDEGIDQCWNLKQLIHDMEEHLTKKKGAMEKTSPSSPSFSPTTNAEVGVDPKRARTKGSTHRRSSGNAFASANAGADNQQQQRQQSTGTETIQFMKPLHFVAQVLAFK